MRQMLTCVTVIAAQTEADANRFLDLGATADQVQVTGNLKFDSRLPTNLSEQVEALRQQWGTDRLIWIAASTHEGEEEQILAAFLQVKRHFKHLLLVLVPRHPERFNRVTTLCKQRGFVTVRRSEGRICTSQTDIYIGDTMGELPYLYAACDVAFVGGSLVPIGGHNLMEPAAVGLPIIVGPYTFECAHISRRLWEEGVAYQVNNFVELATVLKMLLGDKKQRREMGDKGRLFVQQNRGALEKILTIVNNYLGNQSSVTVVSIPTLTMD
jgi:3-deoxy-D-manno-octulosonic-acid transferase